MRTALGDDPMTFKISANARGIPCSESAAAGDVAPIALNNDMDPKELRGRILRGMFGGGSGGSYTGRSDLSRVVS
jgi:hypothetical protein